MCCDDTVNIRPNCKSSTVCWTTLFINALNVGRKPEAAYSLQQLIQLSCSSSISLIVQTSSQQESKPSSWIRQ